VIVPIFAFTLVATILATFMMASPGQIDCLDEQFERMIAQGTDSIDNARNAGVGGGPNTTVERWAVAIVTAYRPGRTSALASF
jgi:hypothetical protein